MSQRRNRRRKKKRGCGCGITSFFLLILLTVVLIYSGAISNLQNYIEKQMYPLYYKEEILLAASKYDFEPEFICAVIHTESKFKAEAQSHAGACGLMQLMPETFEEIANKKGEERTSEDMLIPKINIDYGTAYLRHLCNTFGYEDIYTACAAYNAGPGNVDKWLMQEQYSYDGKTLISTPYKETTNYIKRIKTAQDMYAKLYFEQ